MACNEKDSFDNSGDQKVGTLRSCTENCDAHR